MRSVQRIGILGGTFDPIHNGHLKLAQEAMSKLSLGKVIFMPAFVPPHKANQPTAHFADRFAMVKAAVDDSSAFAVSDLEYRRGGQSYTYDTLVLLNAQYPNCQWFFLTGADVLTSFNKWYRWQEILDLATLVITTRPGFYLDRSDILDEAMHTIHKKALFLTIDAEDISSTAIRRLIAEGKPWQSFLPKAVTNYIIGHHLYGG